jgi:hypothetical protein
MKRKKRGSTAIITQEYKTIDISVDFMSVMIKLSQSSFTDSLNLPIRAVLLAAFGYRLGIVCISQIFLKIGHPRLLPLQAVA